MPASFTRLAHLDAPALIEPKFLQNPRSRRRYQRWKNEGIGELPSDEIALFLASLIFNLLVSIGLFFAFGGLDLLRQRVGTAPASPDPEIDDTGGTATEMQIEGYGTSPAAQLTAPAPQAVAPGHRVTREQIATLIGLVALAAGALAFNLNVGLVAMSVAVVLALISPYEQKGAVDKVSWSTVLLVGGVITYIAVVQKSGAIDAVGQSVSGIGAPLLAALLLCYIGGVVSAFASSVAVLGATIPLAVPFLQQGQIGSVGMIAALAIASTIVDVSPFSTNGALVVANAAPEERDSVYKQFLIYSILVIIVGPALAWLLLIVPGWL